MTFWSPSCLSTGSCQYLELEDHITVPSLLLKNPILSPKTDTIRWFFCLFLGLAVH